MYYLQSIYYFSFSANWVQINGTLYQRPSVLMIGRNDENDDPIFGDILEMGPWVTADCHTNRNCMHACGVIQAFRIVVQKQDSGLQHTRASCGYGQESDVLAHILNGHRMELNRRFLLKMQAHFYCGEACPLPCPLPSARQTPSPRLEQPLESSSRAKFGCPAILAMSAAV